MVRVCFVRFDCVRIVLFDDFDCAYTAFQAQFYLAVYCDSGTKSNSDITTQLRFALDSTLHISLFSLLANCERSNVKQIVLKSVTRKKSWAAIYNVNSENK